MNGAFLFSLGPATAKDYIKVEISAKFQPFRNKSKSHDTFHSNLNKN